MTKREVWAPEPWATCWAPKALLARANKKITAVSSDAMGIIRDPCKVSSKHSTKNKI